MRGLIADPGGTTGWGIMDWCRQMDIPPELLLSGETPGEMFPETMRQLIQDNAVDFVVYERFRIFKKTVGVTAVPVLKQIGEIERICKDLSVPFYDQTPDKKEMFLPRLKAFDMHQATRGGHVNDAVAHGLYYFAKQKCEGQTPTWVLLGIGD